MELAVLFQRELVTPHGLELRALPAANRESSEVITRRDGAFRDHQPIEPFAQVHSPPRESDSLVRRSLHFTE